MSEIIEAPAVAARLARDLPHWRVADGQLHRVYRVTDFKGAMLVTVTIGHLAEAAGHHPDLLVTYDKVAVSLVTHSAGGITEKDFCLAAKIESVLQWKLPEGSHYVLEN